MDLTIDVEKGEVVSKASSHNGTPMLSCQPDIDSSKQAPAFMEALGSKKSESDRSDSRSLTPVGRVHSESGLGLRPERLRNLGFHFQDKNKIKKKLEAEEKKSEAEQTQTEIMIQNINSSFNLQSESTHPKMLEAFSETKSPINPVEYDISKEIQKHDQMKIDNETIQVTDLEPKTKRFQAFTSKIIVKPSEVEISLSNPNELDKTGKNISRARVEDKNWRKPPKKVKTKLYITENQNFRSDTLEDSVRIDSLDDQSIPVESDTDEGSLTDYENELNDGTKIDSESDTLEEGIYEPYTGSTLSLRTKSALSNQMNKPKRNNMKTKKDNMKTKMIHKHVKIKSLSTESEYSIESTVIPDYGIISDNIDKRTTKHSRDRDILYPQNHLSENRNAKQRHQPIHQSYAQRKTHDRDLDFERDSGIPDRDRPIPRTFSNYSYNDQAFTKRSNIPSILTNSHGKQYVSERPIYEGQIPMQGVVNPALFSYGGPYGGHDHIQLQR